MALGRSDMNDNMNKEFCSQLRDQGFMVGTFVKFTDPAVIEILASFKIDFIVIDAEHAPLGRQQVSNLLMAATASRLPAIVRVPEGNKLWISTALDAGAAGVMVPHVSTVDEAERLVRLMKFGVAGRGFSPSTRAAGFGTRGIAKHLVMQPDETSLICQIEDRIGVENAGDIAAVDGVDCLFVGPVDLAVSLGHTDVKDPDVVNQCEQVVRSSAHSNTAAGMYLSSIADARAWREIGVSIAVIGTDQAFIRSGAGTSLG